MRIVAGTLRGRKIGVRIPAGVRPTTERLREALFSTLASRLSFDTMTWLDLFGGTGAIGFEALSRGAPEVVYNDRNGDLAAQVRREASRLGVTPRMNILTLEAFQCVDRLQNTEFGIIFLDPPYRYAAFEELGQRLPPARYVVVESTSEVTLGSRWVARWWRRYGDTRLGLFEQVMPDESMYTFGSSTSLVRQGTSEERGG
ncbi:RsmD family RNA methyltransferase [Ferrimicrobium sp.]|uniref:RsmD family RNA methyltransferase n=1 Tax=Ferrimicrobium sp. TaxID=2926050 RepID=UPI002612651A|nr:RsmD family RNA methyltransferase [Ferrimicrobium sp.]